MNEQKPVTQQQFASLQRKINELEKKVEQVQKDVAVVQDQNDEFDKKQTDMIRLQEEARIREMDTNKNAHEAKHGMLNVKSNIEGFKMLYEQTQEAIRKNNESIAENSRTIAGLAPLKPMMDEIIAWMKGFQGLETLDGWRKLKSETDLNTKLRERLYSFWAAVGGLSAIIALGYALKTMLSK